MRALPLLLLSLSLAVTAHAQSGVGIELDDVIDNRMSAGPLLGSLEVRVNLKGSGLDKVNAARVLVKEARDDAEALRAARRIANSPLVKTAVFGGDPNWGRILQTVGAARVRVNLPRTEVWLAGVPVFRAGAPTGPAARARAGARMRDACEVEIAVRLGAGRGAARLWTCDYSYDYVRINAEYTT